MLGFSAASRGNQNQQWVDMWSRYQILGGQPRQGSHSRATSAGNREPEDKKFVTWVKKSEQVLDAGH